MPDPLTDVAPVDAFLAAASLTYESLLELLEVGWVQGGLNVAIQGVDDTCMTSKQSLAPLVAPPLTGLGFLDRAHRFLRLWLATGYKMWELDLLLDRPGRGQRHAPTSTRSPPCWHSGSFKTQQASP